MLGLVLWTVRVLLFVMILRILASFFLKRGQPFSGMHQEDIKRFKADKGTVVDADFKDL